MNTKVCVIHESHRLVVISLTLTLLLLFTPPDALLAASPDFQTKLGYPLPPPNGANLSTASKANAQKYNTLSLVLEQPFKDTIGEQGGHKLRGGGSKWGWWWWWWWFGRGGGTHSAQCRSGQSDMTGGGG